MAEFVKNCTNSAHINGLEKVNIKNTKKIKYCSIYMLCNCNKNAYTERPFDQELKKTAL